MNDKQINILLVEDDALARVVAKSILVNVDCSVDIAESGQQALTKVKENHYDFIFMDIGLPDISGLEVVRNIRESSKINKNSIIVVLTAHQDNDLKEECASIGINHIITKPITKESWQVISNKY